MTPGSIWLAPDAPCSKWEQADVAGAWEGWGEEERSLYTDVRAAGLVVAESWFTANGHDRELANSLEVRTMCARYAASSVQRFQRWRVDTLQGGLK